MVLLVLTKTTIQDQDQVLQDQDQDLQKWCWTALRPKPVLGADISALM